MRSFDEGNKNPSPKGPLTGIRVLDLTSTLMGPYCTQILCDMGADVIKVEGPDGDTTRYLQDGNKPGMSGMFVNLARGKRSIVLDLKNPDGCEVLSRLIKQSDVFVHSMRFEAIKRLGFSYDAVKQIREDVVYANLYGYSRQGPYADWPAYDDTIQGISGLVMLQAEVTGEPRYVPTVMADKIAGLTAAYAIAMALFHRQRTGEGQEIEVAMFETMVSFLMVEHLGGSLFDPPIADPMYRRAVSQHRRPYRTADGYISALIYSDRQWQKFVAIAGSPEFLCDPRFTTLEMRARHIDNFYAAVNVVMLTRSSEGWIGALREAGIPVVPLKSLKDLLSDPHLEQTGFFVSKDTKEGKLKFPGIPTRFSATPGHIREAGPLLGEHTVAIMREAGFAEAEIASCLHSGGARTMPAVADTDEVVAVPVG
jgi:crotonobetainyl-CoA:carnitine CoA-transferase CaiB-like acyl-CoA transferase